MWNVLHMTDFFSMSTVGHACDKYACDEYGCDKYGCDKYGI